ncbi:MAG: hypothetical protein ACK4KT_10325, partial [Thermaurantimonas sp.]
MTAEEEGNLSRRLNNKKKSIPTIFYKNIFGQCCETEIYVITFAARFGNGEIFDRRGISEVIVLK